MGTAKDLGPLDWKTPIVTPAGQPTPEFQRRWNTQRANNALIGSVSFGNGPPTGTPQDGAEYVDISATPALLYIGYGGSWKRAGVRNFIDLADVPNNYSGAGSKLVQVNPGATGIQFATISQALDAMGATQGDVLYRGASGWTALGPGTTGQVLTSGGAGANPSWTTASSGGGAMVKISGVVTSGSQTSVTFSSIPGTYSHLQIFLWGRSLAAVANDDIDIQFNGDTGSNYARQYITNSGSTTLATGGTYTTTSIAALGSIPGTSVAANYPGAAVAFIPGYASTAFNKSLMNLQTFSSGLGSTNMGTQIIDGVWNNTAAITSIKVFPSSGSGFANGSVVTLYGIL